MKTDRMAHVRAQQLAAFRTNGRGAHVLDALEELVRGVARATAELCAEEYESPAELWAERTQVADTILEATREEAKEDPEAPYARVRHLLEVGSLAELRQRNTGTSGNCGTHGFHYGLVCPSCRVS